MEKCWSLIYLESFSGFLITQTKKRDLRRSTLNAKEAYWMLKFILIIKNHLVYIAYSHQIGKKSFTRIARGALKEDRLVDFKIIFTADEKHYTSRAIHFGSRIIFYDNHIYFTIGDSFERDEAQDLNTPNGKIHRLTYDGDIPNDNPFTNSDGSKSSIWTYGNRNPQGLAVTKDGIIWETEHGPRGGDELNIIRKGINYGWPKIYGINYIGTKITDYTEMEGMEQPIWH